MLKSLGEFARDLVDSPSILLDSFSEMKEEFLKGYNKDDKCKNDLCNKSIKIIVSGGAATVYYPDKVIYLGEVSSKYLDKYIKELKNNSFKVNLITD